eukprot:63521-Alexandrium_andersonii.AAC.1
MHGHVPPPGRHDANGTRVPIQLAWLPEVLLHSAFGRLREVGGAGDRRGGHRGQPEGPPSGLARGPRARSPEA